MPKGPTPAPIREELAAKAIREELPAKAIIDETELFNGKNISFEHDDHEFEREFDRWLANAPKAHKSPQRPRTATTFKPAHSLNPSQSSVLKAIDESVDIAPNKPDSCAVCGTQEAVLCTIKPCLHQVCQRDINEMLEHGALVQSHACPACKEPVNTFDLRSDVKGSTRSKFASAKRPRHITEPMSRAPIPAALSSTPNVSSSTSATRSSPASPFTPLQDRSNNSFSTHNSSLASKRSFLTPDTSISFSPPAKEIAVLRIDHLPTSKATLTASLARFLVEVEGVDKDTSSLLADTPQPGALVAL
jgi:hypothetical protein